MKTLDEAIEVQAPASVAYNVWTQFELFPAFMEGVEEVRQLDAKHLQWRADVFGKTEEWKAEITEQIPDKRIAWQAEGGVFNAGAVTFHRLSDDSARIMVQLGYEPETLAEKAGDALGLLDRRVRGDLERFKEYVERHGDRVEGWRGEIKARPDRAQKEAPRPVG